MKRLKTPALAVFALSALLLVSGCAKKDAFPASNAFYINDQAEALLSSSKYLIYATSLNLYENTSQTSAAKEGKTNGAQVVVATALAPVDSLPSTDIFNEWGIGDNDMGLFLLLYFAPSEDDEYSKEYLGTVFEIGSQMAGHISMSRLISIFDATWPTSGLSAADYDTKLVNFYLEVVEEISEKVYLNTSFSPSQKLEWYEENKYESFFNFIPSGTVAAKGLPWWAVLLIILGALVLTGTSPLLSLLLGNGSGTTHKGGGGSSRGYKTRR